MQTHSFTGCTDVEIGDTVILKDDYTKGTIENILLIHSAATNNIKFFYKIVREEKKFHEQTWFVRSEFKLNNI